MKIDIHAVLGGKWTDGTRPKDLFRLHIMQAPTEYIEDIMTGLGSDDRRVQSGCAEIASLLSEEHPELFYPHIDVFIENLTAKEPVLRWEAVCTIGNLSRVNTERRIIPFLDKIAAHYEAMLS